jgi:hypothetical protein
VIVLIVSVIAVVLIVAIIYAMAWVVVHPVLVVEDETSAVLVAVRDHARDGGLVQGTAGRLHYDCVDLIVDGETDGDRPCGNCKRIAAEVGR